MDLRRYISNFPFLLATITGFCFCIVLLIPFIIDKPLLLFFIFAVIAVSLFFALNNFILDEKMILYLLIFSSLLLPPISISSGLPNIRIEEILFVVLLPLYFVLNKIKPTDPALNLFLKFYFAFVFIQIISTIYGKLFLNVPVGIRDLFEIIKTAKYGFVVFIIGYFHIDKNLLKKLIYTIIFLFIVSSFIGHLQFHGIFGFEQLTAPLYFEDRIHDVFNRMMGTYFNPNSYGTVLSIGAIFIIATIVRVDTYEKKAGLLLTLFFLIWTITLTQSRTSVGAFLIGSFVYLLLLSYTYNLRWYLPFIGLLGVFTFLIAIFSILPREFIERYVSALNIMSDLSWLMRLYAWYLNLEIFFQSPLIGWGPAKHLHPTVVDSEYILILRQFGVIGFFSYLFIYILPLSYSFKFIKGKSIVSTFNHIFITCSVIFIVGNITNPLFHEIQFMDFWAILLGVLYASNRLHTKNSASMKYAL